MVCDVAPRRSKCPHGIFFVDIADKSKKRVYHRWNGNSFIPGLCLVDPFDLCLSQSWNWLRTATTLDTSKHLCEHDVSSRGITPGSHEISRCLLLQEPHFITRIGMQPRDAAMATAVSADLGRWDLLDLCCSPQHRRNIQHPFFAAQHLCSWHNIFFASTTPGSTKWTLTYFAESVTLERDQILSAILKHIRSLDLSDMSWPMQVWHSLEDVSSAHHS